MPYDVMSAVVGALAGNAAVVAAFGHTATTPKFLADEAATFPALPYLVYSETDEELTRVMGGQGYARGTFEVGVFDTTKEGARQKLDLVRRAVNAILQTPQNEPKPNVQLGDGGVLYYLHSHDGSGRKIDSSAPGQGVTEYGRTLIFDYQVTRNDPL